MGGAIADSVTHSQTFDTDFRSLEIELGTSHRKTHTSKSLKLWKKHTILPSVSPPWLLFPTYPYSQAKSMGFLYV